MILKLPELLKRKRSEVAAARQQRNMSWIRTIAEEKTPAQDFGCALLALSDAPTRVIADCSRRNLDFSKRVGAQTEALDLAKASEQGGAAAISIWTDSIAMNGSLEELRTIRAAVKVPVLRRDFIVDDYQIFESRAAGADSYLLLAECLDFAELQYFVEIGRDLGMEPLVHVSDKIQLEQVLKTDAKILGIGRPINAGSGLEQDSLLSFAAGAIRQSHGRILVFESAINKPEEIAFMKKFGFSAFLVSEALVTKNDSETAANQLQGAGSPEVYDHDQRDRQKFSL